MGTPMEPGHKMIPCTDALIKEMMGAVCEMMVESGLIDEGDDETEIAQGAQVLREQGVVNESGDLETGKCILLPPPGIRLLLVMPWPADRYGPELQRKSPPIQFERTEQDEIILPFRCLLGKLEELASNPAASEALRIFALNVSRRAESQPDTLLPASVVTVALNIEEKDGTITLTEALAPGLVISWSGVEEED